MMQPSATMLFATLALPWLAALALFALPNDRRNAAAGIAGGATLLALTLLALQGPAMFDGLVLNSSVQWLPFKGADFGLRADGLAWTFAMLVLVIGALVVLYARYYLSDSDPMARFYAFFMLFMGAMLGVVLADNLLLLVVFWELTSIASFLLIGYWQGRADARQGARLSLTITAAGGLALLGGVLLLGEIVGSFKLDDVLAAGDAVRAHPWYAPALLLILAGAFSKSAQFPLHFWLPQAMAAPTPVSAYLHSATLVKAGVFLLARLHPTLSGTDLWFYVVSLTGLATLLVGAYVAVFQHDLKGLLAYSTISHLGLITLLFGLSTPLATVAGVFHILNHATFKASLFMAAGIIDHEAGSRDMRHLNGLWKYMPVTAVLAIVASSAMAGVPLLNGFLSKEMFFAETLGLDTQPVLAVLIPLLATLAAAFSVAYSVRFIHDVFWNGEPKGLPRMPHDPPFWMLVPVGALALLCVLVGTLPAITIGPLLATTATPVVGGTLPYYSLAIWHGLNLPLLMSVVALGVGVVFYFMLQRLFRLHDLVHLPRGGREILDFTIAAAVRLARALTGRIVNGSLQRSVLLICAAAVVVGVWPWLTGTAAAPATRAAATAAGPAAWTLWLIALVALAALLLRHRERLEALIYLGVVGLTVSLTFGALSAPDLLLTQLLVEVASVLLLLLALNFLPRQSTPTDSSARRWRDAVIALAGGIGVSAIVHAVLTRPRPDSLAPWFLENAVPGAFGTNAVNVILVDFRAFDTLGEITVLGLAALLVASLLPRAEAPAATPVPPAGAAPAREFSLMLEITSRVMLPLTALVAAWFFIRGHNLPGGGFIGGLVLAIGLLLPYLGSGTSWVEQRSRPGFEAWIGWGLACATVTGLLSLALGYPFLTSTYFAPVLPVVDKISIASAMFFDLGVFLAVAGASMLALTRLGRLGEPQAQEQGGLR
jgi:multicomponent K+:H+ antiporter subunit A